MRPADPTAPGTAAEQGSPGGSARRGPRPLLVAAYVGVWLVLALAIGLAQFLGSSKAVSVASHDAMLTPDFSGEVVLLTGPVLPDLRLDSGSPIGMELQLGKTDAASTDALFERYGYIASQPDGVRARLSAAVVDLAVDAAVRGALLAAVPVGLWVLLGPRRRRELLRLVPTWQGAVAMWLTGALVLGLWAPWRDDGPVEDTDRWMTLGTFLGSQVPIPAEAAGLEVRGDVTTAQTRRLLESAVETYDKSKTFYAAAEAKAVDLDLREPGPDETVALLISDRHDNIGMDAVARAVGDAAGATAILNGGDDTSTGAEWEGFSLDSLSAAFDEEPYEDRRYGIAGNHDRGDFVRDRLLSDGWQMLDGEIVEGPGGSTILGVDDPRSSGLGSWRDEGDLSFTEVADQLADTACTAAEDEGEPIGTLLVHDANLGDEALRRGCVDLVVGGHLHVDVGPERVVAENGSVGYSYTTGTTGGAAYAIAIGSKIRRPAQISLITYRDGRPVGLQLVELQTNGRFDVAPYVALHRD
ncbi:metallophosphoesterase [Nocardioides ochotonae]|uniref:metallophosphoesterase n=1 Tax=Nocardioides ochotonae TaxID=2685869 RepID=UPI00313325C6